LNIGYHDKSIAIMDDEEDIVSLFLEAIEQYGYFVLGFTNPNILINYIHQHPDRIGLILIDYKLPRLTGCELAKQIFRINPKIKMILVSAYDDIKNNDLNLEIVKKPITLSKLLRIIQQHLS
jgi:DNA-binding NtrC family response regulator